MLAASLQHLIASRRSLLGLLVVFGLVVVSLPLVQAWRHQGLEIRATEDARRALVASSQAVRTQQALAAHRPHAAAVLAGRPEQEPERLRHQQAVDTNVGTLTALLEAQQLHRALEETDQLRAGWARLLEGIGHRRITPASSHAAHDLLIEQAFVVMDLIGSDSGSAGQSGRILRGDEWLLAHRTLPRLAMSLAAEAADAEDNAAQDEPPHRQAALHAHARRAARGAALALESAHGRAAHPGEPAPEPGWVRALSAVQQHAAELAGDDGASAANRDARRRALVASIEAQDALVARIDADLAALATDLQAGRVVLAAAGLVLLMIGSLAAAMVPHASSAETAGIEPTTARAEAAEFGDPDGQALDSRPGRPESRDPAEALLGRLRQQRGGAPVGADPAAGAAPQAHP